MKEQAPEKRNELEDRLEDASERRGMSTEFDCYKDEDWEKFQSDFNPWSLVGLFVDQQMAMTSPIPAFGGLRQTPYMPS